MALENKLTINAVGNIVAGVALALMGFLGTQLYTAHKEEVAVLHAKVAQLEARLADEGTAKAVTSTTLFQMQKEIAELRADVKILLRRGTDNG